MSQQLSDVIALFKRLDAQRGSAGLDADEQREWLHAKELIERQSAPGAQMPPSSRRRSLRVPTRLEVRFEDARGFERAYLRNISEGGVYVATSRDMRMGDRFQLSLTVEEPAQRLELAVEVVWVNRTPSPSSGLEPGVGVAWLALSPEEKRAIKAIVHRALDELPCRS
jgi:uncharacterized protein (TIGR02266 family)